MYSRHIVNIAIVLGALAVIISVLRPTTNQVATAGTSPLLATVHIWHPLIAKNYPTLTPTLTPGSDPLFVGAGDIATCANSNDEATARLLDGIAGTVFTLGDNAYESGTATEFATCYAPNWGRHKTRTRPAAGNHDYNTSGASGYFNYFGAAAGNPGEGYPWHWSVYRWLEGENATIECIADPRQAAAGFRSPQWPATGSGPAST